MHTIRSGIIMALVSLLNNEPINVNKYVNENIQTFSYVGHSLKDLEFIKQRDAQLNELKELVSNLTNKYEKIMHLTAALDIKDFSDDKINNVLSDLYERTEKVIIASEYHFKNSQGAFKDEHEKVLYHAIVLDTYLFALIDEDLQKITAFKRTVPEDIFATGKRLYAMDKRAEGIFT